MRRTFLLGVVICCLFSTSRSKSTCDLSEKQETDETFPDLLTQSFEGYQLTTEFSNNKTRETIFINEAYNVIDKSGRLELYRNKNFQQFVYFHDTNETFTISGFTCRTGKLTGTLPFLEDNRNRYINSETDRTILGPSALLRQGFLSWKEGKVGYFGNSNEDRAIRVDKWRQCLDDTMVEYYFSEPTWNNAFNFSNMKIPIKARYINENEEQTYEFFNYQAFLSNPELTYNVPEGYGCIRTAKNEVDVPEMLDRDHLLRGEMVFHSNLLDARKYSRFVSTFEIAYHYKSETIGYSYASWKKGSKDKDGTVDTKPFSRTIWDNRNNFLYDLNLESRRCSFSRDTEFTPNFELPGENDGSIDLLDPNLLISTDGFNYLGDRTERGIPVYIFEKEVSQFYLVDKLAPVAVITRTYATDAAVINTGNHEKQSPVRITISWYADNQKTQIQGILVVNIFSYSSEVPFINDILNVGMCFPDYDGYTWFKITFPNTGVDMDALQARTKEIQSEFLGFLYQNTEVTPVRIQRVMVDVTDDDFSVDVKLIERPPIYLEFDSSTKAEIAQWDENYGMLSEEECLQSCVEYSNNDGKNCMAVSYCGATCYISTKKAPNTFDNDQCLMYKRQVVAVSVPAMDTLVRSIKKLVITDQFALSFLANIGDLNQLVTFKASSFSDSLGDIRRRYIPQLLRDGIFSLSFPGMKIIKGEKDQSKPTRKSSLTSCLQTCLNNPYCETVSYCQRTECIISDSYITEINIDRTERNTKCIILARNYLNAYKPFPGITLTKSAENVVNAESADGCARGCLKETHFQCRSFDFCKSKGQCLLHSTHYLDLKSEGAGIKTTKNCTHYSKKYVYDFKMIPNKRSVGETEVVLRNNDVEECARECTENGAFDCTAFDFCEEIEAIDNKCFLISTIPSNIKTVDRPGCRHYLNQGVKWSKGNQGKRYSRATAGGLGFLFFIIGSALGIGGAYFFAYKYANRG